MKKLLILSGKGGTGKTTVAGAFIKYSETNSFADCDVDAPNLHIISKFDVEPKNRDYMGSPKSVIDPKKCLGCGICADHCRFNAIHKAGDKYEVNEYACEGCGVCTLVCPAGAVTLNDDVAGDVSVYEDDRLFTTAKLKMGRGTSGKLVSDVKATLYKNMKRKGIENQEGITVIDGSPGIGCPVIASISGVDMLLIVTEPTLSGMSDMKRILDTGAIFEVPTAVCVNKYDINPEICKDIENYCDENKIEFLGTIPYDSAVSKAVNRGISIAEVESPASDALKQIYDEVAKILI